MNALHRLGPLIAALSFGAGYGCDKQAAEQDTTQANENRHEITGTYDLGDAQSDWTATIDGDALVRVTERMTAGDYGESTFVYNFQDASLTRYLASGRQRAASGDMVDLDIRMAFDNGKLVSVVKSIDGSQVTPEPFEAPGVLRRAAALAEQVALRRGHPPPHFRCQGNEPFWNLKVRDTQGIFSALGDEQSERPLTARWQWDTSASPAAALRWSARQSSGGSLFMSALVVEEQCLDTMSDETPPFDHSVILDLSSGGTVTGCCRPADK